MFVERGWDLLRPHNEHWSTVPLLAWKGTTAVFGVGQYLPFHTVLLAMNVTMAAGVYALLRGSFAVCAAALLLFLGSGADQLMSAFQIGFVASAAAGVWALFLIERTHYVWAALLLILAVASSGMGLAFLASAITLGLLRRERGAVWLAAPVAVYGAWYVLASRTGTAGDLLRLPGFLLEQVVWSSGALTALPGLLVVLFVLGLAAWRARDVLTLACVAGIGAEYIIIGLVRSEGGPRYQTTFAVLALIGAGRFSWPNNRYFTALGIAAFAWALFVNIGWLLAYLHEFAIWVTLPGNLC